MKALAINILKSLRPSDACVSELPIIGSNNGVSPGRRQAITWTNAGILLTGTFRTNFSEILCEIRTLINVAWKTVAILSWSQCVKACLATLRCRWIVHVKYIFNSGDKNVGYAWLWLILVLRPPRYNFVQILEVMGRHGTESFPRHCPFVRRIHLWLVDSPKYKTVPLPCNRWGNFYSPRLRLLHIKV